MWVSAMRNSHSPSATTSLESPWPAVSGLVNSLVQQGFDWLSEYSTCMCLSRSPSPLPPPTGRRLLLLTVCSWPELLCPCCELEAAPKCKVQDLWEGSGNILGKGLRSLMGNCLQRKLRWVLFLGRAETWPGGESEKEGYTQREGSRKGVWQEFITFWAAHQVTFLQVLPPAGGEWSSFQPFFSISGGFHGLLMFLNTFMNIHPFGDSL